MKIIMTGGGTGGHIYPAIAIADKIKEKHPDAEILFIGTKRGLEKSLVPENGYDIRFITVTGFNRKKLWKNIKVLMEFSRGFGQAKNIIKEYKPDMVIGTGGYVCGPVVRAANQLDIPTYIHEQNAFPGLTNKFLSRYARKVFISFKEARKYFKNQEKLIMTGNPVREGFLTARKDESRKYLGIPPNDFVILSFGGSQGAARINEVMQDVAVTISGIDKMQLYFATGKQHYEKIQDKLKEKGVLPGGNIHLLPYIEKMDLYLSAADVVISRAGALTISEITVCGKPSILIPSPNVTGNHQFFNGKAIADLGGAVLIEEKDLTDEVLIRELLSLKNNKEILAKMATVSRMVAKDDAAEMIYRNLEI